MGGDRARVLPGGKAAREPSFCPELQLRLGGRQRDELADRANPQPAQAPEVPLPERERLDREAGQELLLHPVRHGDGFPVARGEPGGELRGGEPDRYGEGYLRVRGDSRKLADGPQPGSDAAPARGIEECTPIPIRLHGVAVLP